MEKIFARLIFLRYKFKSVEKNLKEFERNCLTIRKLLNTHSDKKLQERKKISPTPGITEIMRDWSPNMIVEHLNLVHKDILSMIYQLEAGKTLAPVDTSQFDLIPEIKEAPMDVFDDLLQEILKLPQTIGFNSKTKYEHPIFGNLTSKDWVALLNIHLGFHVTQLKKSLASQ